MGQMWGTCGADVGHLRGTCGAPADDVATLRSGDSEHGEVKVSKTTRWANTSGGMDLEALIALGKRLDHRVGRGSSTPASQQQASWGPRYREVLASSLLRIRNKRGRLARLECNPAQKEFESRCGARNIELKTHMRWIVGNGNEGKIQELETRIRKHEAALQRTAGIGVAAGILLTIVHLALDSMKVMHR